MFFRNEMCVVTRYEVLRVCLRAADADEADEIAERARREGANPYGETFYILQSPTNKNVWAVLRDSMNWDEPSESDLALKAAVAEMVETLAFEQ